MKKGKKSLKKQMVKVNQEVSATDSSCKPKSLFRSVASSIVTGFLSGLARAAGEEAYKTPPDVPEWLSKLIENLLS